MDGRIDVEHAQTNSGIAAQNVSLNVVDTTPFTDATRVGIAVGGINITTRSDSHLNASFEENVQVSEFLKDKLGWRSLSVSRVRSWDNDWWELMNLFVFIAPFFYTGVNAWWEYENPPRAYVDYCTQESGAAVAYADCVICMGTRPGEGPYDPKSTQPYAGRPPREFGHLVPWIKPRYDGDGFGYWVWFIGVSTLLVVEFTWLKFWLQRNMMSRALRRGVYISMPQGSKYWALLIPVGALFALGCSIVHYNNAAELHGFPIGNGPDGVCLAPSTYAGHVLNPGFFDDNPTNPTKHKAEEGWYNFFKTVTEVLFPFIPIIIKFWNAANDNYSYITLSVLLDSRAGARMLFSHIHSRVTYACITTAALSHPDYVNEGFPRKISHCCIGNEKATLLCLKDEEAQGFLQDLRNKGHLKPVGEELSIAENYCCFAT